MIKLTGGYLKGRSIQVTPGLNTRPSSAKVRESIFNIIADKVIDCNWLDLFGGTGAIGLEALSRGAEKVTFIEKEFTALNCLKKNILLFNLGDKTFLLKQDALNFLKNCSKSYDFIFLDTSSSGMQTLFNVMNMVDKTFVLTTPEATSIEKTHRWFDYCMDKKVDLDNIGLIVNACRTLQQNGVGFNIHSIIAKKYGVTCAQIGHFPFDNCAWQSSMANQNLFKTFPSSTICHEIYRFSKQFIDSEQLRAVS